MDTQNKTVGDIQMIASEIMYYTPINKTDPRKVSEIIDSITANGWHGSPILVSTSHGRLITGSHRLEALKSLDFDPDDLGDVAEDVDDIIDKWCEDNDSTIDDIDHSDLAQIFRGTWVEQYKDEIEW